MRIKATTVFTKWLEELKDTKGRARIRARIERLALGNPGRHRKLTDSVSELKLTVGPGYRVYYTWHGDELIVLLCGGDKSSQSQDIQRAQRLAAEL